MNDKCLSSLLRLVLGTSLVLSKKDIQQLRNFSMAQQALSLALLEAKHLGICKTTMSEDVVGVNPGDTSGRNDVLKEMSC